MITLDACQAKVHGKDWMDFKEGDKIIAPAKTELNLKV